jgi:effector-binding domain-containing protein
LRLAEGNETLHAAPAGRAGSPCKESLMFLRIARFRVTAAAFAMTVALAAAPTLPSHAQTAPPAAAPTTTPAAVPPVPSPAAKPESKPAEPTPVAPEGITTKPTDAFGEDVTLTAKPIVYIKGSGTWDKAYVTISGALKKVEAYVAKAGLKTDGQPVTIFLATDDLGFDYEAAVPLAEAPKDPPHGEISAGQSPDGRALKFVHRGSYDSLDDTYEAITNYLDDKRLESKNVLIEQYVTDPVAADPKNLVINIFVLVN